MRNDPPTPWWRNSVIYQVYIRSFADGNADGIGDIAGLRSRLPYLHDLGVDAIWVNPWYPSPFHDGGYDVADYRDINPAFGTLDEATGLIADARAMGMRVLVDLVPNHTSSEHPWFQEALHAPPGSPARQRYHFRPGRGPAGDHPPTNWDSVFGGSAWTRVPDGEWYLHLFDPTQPDLNWSNPAVRAEFRDILRFWLDRGAAGFRVDVAHSLTKDMTWPDLGHDEESHSTLDGNHPHWDRTEVHEIIREWRAVLDEYPDTMMVAEAWVANWDRLAAYIRHDEYHQAFDFDFLEQPWDAAAMRSSIGTSLAAAARVGSIPTWVLSNHDVVRAATRYALPKDVVPKEWLLDGDRSLLDDSTGLRRARAAALLMLALPGSAYLYQGEELGLPEAYDLPIEVLDDPVWLRSAHTRKGRDGCRVPLPWTSNGPSFGFGEDGSWLPQPPRWAEYAESSQDDVQGSTLELYRAALYLRRQHLVQDEQLTWLDLGPEVIALRRGSGVSCIVNFGGDPVTLPEGEVLVASHDLFGDQLPGDAAVWLIESE
jgi:alpha-glucosidase